MIALAIFLKTSPASFKWLLIISAYLILSRVKTVVASPFLLDFYFSGYNLEVDDWTSSGRQLYLSDCTDVNGRIFNFTASGSFRLSGLSLFFYKDGSSSPINALKPEELSVSLFEGGAFDVAQTLVFRSPFKGQSSSHNGLAENFSLGLSQARALLFEVVPVWLEKNKTYTVVVECPSGLLTHKIYGDAKMTDVKSFNSQTLTVSSKDNIRKPYFQLYSKNDGLVKIMPTKNAPARRPVILVHGLGGLPTDFNDLVDALAAAGWSRDYLLPFDYGLKADGGYNNFGDLFDLNARFNLAVAPLSARFRAEGGDGKIDIVSYSSGGLVARHYLAAPTGDHQIRRFVSLAAPFKGSFLADLDLDNASFTGVETKLPLRLAKIVGPSFSDLKPLTFGRVPTETDFRSQIKSGSSKVSADRKENLPTDLAYFNLQGEITAQLTQKVFQSSIKVAGSLGDGAVLGESAADLPNVTSTLFGETLNLSRLLKPGSLSAVHNLIGLDLTNLKFLHQNLLKASEVKARILEILKQ